MKESKFEVGDIINIPSIMVKDAEIESIKWNEDIGQNEIFYSHKGRTGFVCRESSVRLSENNSVLNPEQTELLQSRMRSKLDYSSEPYKNKNITEAIKLIESISGKKVELKEELIKGGIEIVDIGEIEELNFKKSNADEYYFWRRKIEVKYNNRNIILVYDFKYEVKVDADEDGKYANVTNEWEITDSYFKDLKYKETSSEEDKELENAWILFEKNFSEKLDEILEEDVEDVRYAKAWEEEKEWMIKNAHRM